LEAAADLFYSRAMSHREPLLVDGLDAFTEAGRRLRDVDPDKFRRVLALALAFVALHEPQLESEEMFLARCADIEGRNSKPVH
jgi:hypothetical protein